jgi:hypothetical protein
MLTRPLTLTCLLALSPLVACNGVADAIGGGPTPDASIMETGAPDAAPTDAGAASADDAAFDYPPLPDGAVLPQGTLLVPLVKAASSELYLNGITSDDYAVFTTSVESNTTPSGVPDVLYNTVYALSLAPGSTPITLGTVPNWNGFVAISGRGVILGNGASPTSQGGTPVATSSSIWTSALAAPAPLGSGVVPYDNARSGAVSSDGTRVVFFDENASHTGWDLYGAATDGSAKTVLVSSIDVSNPACRVNIQFAGDVAVAAYCTVADGGATDAGGPDGGTTDAGEPDGGVNLNVATLRSFAGASWTPSVIATNVASAFVLDPGGTKVVVNGLAGTVVYPIAGGAPVTLDPTGALGGTASLYTPGLYSPGIFSRDGQSFFYPTTSDALRRVSVAAPSTPTTLVGSGSFSDVFTLSPDGSWILGCLTWQYTPVPAPGPFPDLYLASATTPGAATALDPTPGSAMGGGIFTADSSHVVYQSDFVTNIASGPLMVRALTPGAAESTLAQGVSGVQATTGAKILFARNDDYPTFDLLGVDTSQSAPPAVAVSVVSGFALNAAKTTIVYAWTYQTGKYAGLWAMPAP